MMLCNSRIIHCRRQGDVWYYLRDLRAEKRVAKGVAAALSVSSAVRQ